MTPLVHVGIAIHSNTTQLPVSRGGGRTLSLLIFTSHRGSWGYFPGFI
jgi:hypothetical protein